ncbi:hypothetical protein DSECCO2_309980 [anaerobic digester metagenome]
MEKLYAVTENGVTTFIYESDVHDDIKVLAEEKLALIGWSIVEDTPRPADTETETYDLKVGFIDGRYVKTWIKRLKTNEEITRDEVEKQIDALNQLLGTSEDIGTDTLRGLKGVLNADINANPAKYIKALADIVIELIKAERRTSRITVRKFESVL